MSHEHTDECKKRFERIAINITAYTQAHPNYCRSCNGHGFHYYDFDPSPAGVSLGSGYMTDCDPCPDCMEKGICPVCGSKSLDEEGDACANCNWKADDTPATACPEQPECYCWEQWERDDMEKFERNDPRHWINW